MKVVVMDSCALIRFLESPMSEASRSLAKYDKVLVPSIVIGEVSAGFFDTRQGREGRMRLKEFLSYSAVTTVPVTDHTAEFYAKIYQQLRKEGRPIPQNDMWIAASAFEHGADLATCDEHFKFIPMLTVVLMPKA